MKSCKGFFLPEFKEYCHICHKKARWGHYYEKCSKCGNYYCPEHRAGYQLCTMCAKVKLNKWISEKIEKAYKDKSKDKYQNAANHFKDVAETYENDKLIKDFSRATQYYEEAEECKVKQAQKELAKGKYQKAAKGFYNVAETYENDKLIKNFSKATKYYKKAVEIYFSIGKKGIGKFTEIILKKLMSTMTDAWDKVEILKDAANKLLESGELKKAAKVVKKLKDIYKKKPIKDKERAKYYEQLAREIKDGTVKEID